MLPLVEQLATTWTSVLDLCADLDEREWKRPTGCPGWSVQDNVSHLVDYESFALGRPRPEHEVGEVAHARNDMGSINEIGVDVRRGRAGAEVLEELRDVTGERLGRLESLTDADLDRQTDTPIGPGTVRDLLTLRVMDTWSHEQDIRRALDRPGHTRGDAADTAIAYLLRFVPFAVAKLAGAPDGTTVVLHVDDRPPFAVGVEGGRGRALDVVPDNPTVVLRTDVAQLQALTCGRSDADPAAVEVAGDEVLGRRIVEHLGFMP